jgi:hypothetical protein
MHSLDDLNAVAKSERPFEFEYIRPGDNETDRTKVPEDDKIFLSVVGAQSETAAKAAASLINASRQKQAAAQITARVGSNAKANPVVIETFESDVEFGQRMAASRLVGWRGITDPWSVENAHRLCRSNRDVAAQVMQQSDNVGNFF